MQRAKLVSSSPWRCSSGSLGSVPLFYALVALETSRSIQCPEPDVRTPKNVWIGSREEGTGEGGAGGKLKLEESQTAIAGDR